MNKNRIIFGGLVAAAIVWIGGSLANDYIRSAVAGLPDDRTPEPVNLVRAIGVGLLSVLLYALIIPRQGKGRSSALTAGLFTYLAGAVFPPFAVLLNGAYPSRAILIQMVWNAFLIPFATLIGCSLYREPERLYRSIQSHR